MLVFVVLKFVVGLGGGGCILFWIFFCVCVSCCGCCLCVCVCNLNQCVHFEAVFKSVNLDLNFGKVRKISKKKKNFKMHSTSFGRPVCFPSDFSNASWFGGIFFVGFLVLVFGIFFLKTVYVCAIVAL